MRSANPAPPLTQPLTTLLEAPHRAMFFVGATALLASMVWWTWALLASWRGWPFVRYAMPVGWAHGLLMQYATLAPFVLGFLLTVFPRWLDLAAVPKRIYAAVFGFTFAGAALVIAAQSGAPIVLPVGLAAMLLGWLTAMFALGSRLHRHGYRDVWSVSAYAALVLGALGLALALLYAVGGSPALMPIAIGIGTFGLLVPVYFTVAHRMVPFFSSNVLAGYRVVRPAWSLLGVWILSLAHLAFDLRDAHAWRWLADLPLTALLLWQWLAWQPWKARGPGLLTVLYIALTWLPLSFGLFTVDSLRVLATGAAGWPLAPLHALTIGFFSSMLVAMVTRVTHGHSGRPLVMGPLPWMAFIGMQLVAVIRVLAECSARPLPYYVLSAALWLLVLMPWVARALWIYLTPRRDGKPG
ncbi:NnrS family protein [Dyella humicola]|uniref:NnrS family protein n=1 Tax=Dyella humicola TaxID=2992126 RepID=UPI0022521B3F|nr:NnrS family protein [Dyella humicola]